MATQNITSNPYNFTITEDMIITPHIVPVVPTGQARYIWIGAQNFQFTVPAHITRILVQHNPKWSYRKDERNRLLEGMDYGPDNGIGLREVGKNFNWNYYNRDNIVAVTPKKTYTLRMWNSGYKNRDYGFILYWSPELNNRNANTIA